MINCKLMLPKLFIINLLNKRQEIGMCLTMNKKRYADI